MIKYIRLLMSIALLTTANAIYAQSYTIKSSEGTPIEIKLYHKSGSGQLSVSIPTDSLLIPDCREVINVHVSNGIFLKIEWKEPNGHNITAINGTTVLSVNKNKINVAAFFVSFADYYLPKIDNIPYSKTYYVATSTLIGSNKSNYTLLFNIIDRVNSTPHAKTDHNLNLHVTLNFDPDQNIFFSGLKNADQVFTINNSAKQYIKGTLPIIALGKITYCYYNGKWCLLTDNELREGY